MRTPRKKHILDLLQRSKYRPLKSNEILKSLKIPKENRKRLKKLLRNLTEEGVIKRLRGGKFVLNSDNRKPSSLESSYKILGVIRKNKNRYSIEPRDEKFPKIFLEARKYEKIKNNDLVVLNIKADSKESQIEKVIGRSGDIDVERKAILYQFALREKFPSKVSREANSIYKGVPANDVGKRIDLRKKTIFTIDNDDARDFDDAVGIKRTKSGYKLWVSIADVSHYVKVGGHIDKEALKRGTSVYMPDKVIPMLPEVLSNNLCSLVPHEDRLTKTVEIDFDKAGNLINYKIYNSVIKSRARLTYSWVAKILDKQSKVKPKEKKIVSSLKLMKELYLKLKKIRIEKGELEFDFPEPEFRYDKNGNIVNVVKSKRNIAHGIIEEFMIAANSAVGDFLSKKKTTAIYRIHEPPDELSMYELKNSLDELGYEFNYNGKVKPKDIQKVIMQAKKRKDKDAVNTLVLKSLKRAEYSTKEVEHFGLAIENYTHFTSPIRRYPDLVVHRLVDKFIENNDIYYENGKLDAISESCSKRERNSDEAERESVDLERSYLMKSHIGEVFEGKVISIMPFGMFIEIEDIFVEGFISKSNMRKGRKRKWFLLGQKVEVKVIEADVERRRVTFDLVG